jgi:hypothetical protein
MLLPLLSPKDGKIFLAAATPSLCSFWHELCRHIMHKLAATTLERGSEVDAHVTRRQCHEITWRQCTPSDGPVASLVG